ncbi:MAG: deoxyribonuclease IV [Planctomycetota bacterium]|jgi:deoxyribonuclease-4
MAAASSAASRPLLGAHVSAAGGVHEAVPRADELGCEAVQVFTRNQRTWKTKALTDEVIAEWRARFKQSPLQKAVAHDSYLINLGSAEKELHDKSMQAFREEMENADALGLLGVVFHPGAHMKKGEEWGIERVRATVQTLLDATPKQKTMLLFENAAGQGTTLGRTLEEIGAMITGLTPRKRVGVCIDTCHLFAAGYDFRTKKNYEAVMRGIEETIGVKRVKCFHLNDSQKELGCRVDRHANIGQGHIGEGAFKLLLRDDRWAGVPMVLETPGGPDGWAKDLATLRRLGGYPKSKTAKTAKTAKKAAKAAK